MIGRTFEIIINQSSIINGYEKITDFMFWTWLDASGAGSWGSLPSAIIFGFACYYGGSVAFVTLADDCAYNSRLVGMREILTCRYCRDSKEDPNEVVAE